MVAVRARGSSAPLDAGGCIVVLRAFLLRLLVLVRFDLRLGSVVDVVRGWLSFLPSIMDAITPGPSDFLGGLDATPAGGGAGPDGGGPCGAALCLLDRSESSLGGSVPAAGSFGVDVVFVGLPPTTALSLRRKLPSLLSPSSSRACIFLVPIAVPPCGPDVVVFFDRLLLLAFVTRVLPESLAGKSLKSEERDELPS